MKALQGLIPLLLLAFVTGCAVNVSTDIDMKGAPACPHRTHEVTDAAGNVAAVDNTPAEDASICAYLAYLSAHVHDGVVDCDARGGVIGADCGEAGAAP